MYVFSQKIYLYYIDVHILSSQTQGYSNTSLYNRNCSNKVVLAGVIIHLSHRLQNLTTPYGSTVYQPALNIHGNHFGLHGFKTMIMELISNIRPLYIYIYIIGLSLSLRSASIWSDIRKPHLSGCFRIQPNYIILV
jgi:hypothetical protein